MLRSNIKAFPVKLAEAFPDIFREDAKRLARDVNEEAFGRENGIKAGNVSFAEMVYDRILQVMSL